MSEKELIFKVMVTFPYILEKAIEVYNKYEGTDFEITEVIKDDVPFCSIRVTKYKPSDIFDLGYAVTEMQYKMKEQGELDW